MNNGREIFKGTFWTTLSTATTALVQILRLSILAHFLDKADFGVVAILTIVLGLTQTFSDLGFASVIMHKRDLTRKDFSSLYWIQLLVFSAIYILVVICSDLVSVYFKEPKIVILLPLSMLDLLLQGIGKLYDTMLQRHFRFRLLAFRNIVSAVISLVFAVVLAILGYGVYSLVLSTLAHSLILNIWNLLQGQRIMRLQLCCHFRPVWPLIKIGVYQTGTQILDYFSSKLDIMIVGRLLGMESLGVYNLAKELIIRAMQFINTIANRVILPYFSIIQDDVKVMRENYCNLIRFISIPNFFIYTVLGVFSAPIVLFLYGKDLIEVSPVMSILAMWGLLISVGNLVGNVVIAKGRTDISFRYTIVRIVVYLPLIYFCATFGLYAISWGQVALIAFSIWLAWYMQLRPLIHLNLLTFLKSFHKGLLLSVTIICLTLLMTEIVNSVIIANSICVLLFFIYVLCWYIINRVDLHYLISMWHKRN